MSTMKSWIRSKRNADLKTHHLHNAYSSPEYILPMSLSTANDTLLSLESTNYSFSSCAPTIASSSSAGIAEMMDDDNIAWGPPKRSKPKKTPRK